jgi:hypothetical protein
LGVRAGDRLELVARWYELGWCLCRWCKGQAWLMLLLLLRMRRRWMGCKLGKLRLVVG